MQSPFPDFMRRAFALSLWFFNLLAISHTDQAFSSMDQCSPAAGTWTNTGSMIQQTDLTDMTDLLLANGKVLVIHPGGLIAEIYDPVTGIWTATAGMSAFRVHFSVTLLTNGKVLVAGGVGGQLDYLSTAELYDSKTGTWTSTGSMHHPRGYHAATLLADGAVLVSGGVDAFLSVTASAELYSPATGAWTTTSSLERGQYDQIALLLANGKVLVAGGNTTNGLPLTSAQLYDPDSKTWSDTGRLNLSRSGNGLYHATATLLPNGKVLAAGGNIYQGSSNGNVASAELFDPTTGAWTMTGSLPGPRSGHTATLLPDGKVLVAGGTDGTNNVSSAFLYEPVCGAWTATASLSAARVYHGASLLPNGKVLVMAGNGANTFSISSAELYDFGLGITPTQHPQPVLSVTPIGQTGVAVSFAGFPGLAYTMQRTPAVASLWTNVAVVSVGGNGIGVYRDFNRPAGQAFYRATYP